MQKIQRLVDGIKDELCGAKHYAEKYLECKAMNESTYATRYKEMALDELKHANYLHDEAVTEIEVLRKVYTPPEDMLDKWEHSHNKFVEKTAWIKQMLSM